MVKVTGRMIFENVAGEISKRAGYPLNIEYHENGDAEFFFNKKHYKYDEPLKDIVFVLYSKGWELSINDFLNCVKIPLTDFDGELDEKINVSTKTKDGCIIRLTPFGLFLINASGRLGEIRRVF